MTIVAVERTVPKIAVSRSFVFWNIPAMPRPKAIKSRPIKANKSNPIKIASKESSPIPPGVLDSIIAAKIIFKNIPIALRLARINDVIPSLDCPCLSN